MARNPLHLTERIVRQLPEDEVILYLEETWESLRVTKKNDVESDLPELLMAVTKVHTSDEIEAIVAFCIAEISRILNPQLPFTDKGTNMKLFKMFVSVLSKSTAEDSSERFEGRIRILECIGGSEELIRVFLNLEGHTKLFAQLFEATFLLASHENFEHTTESVRALSCVIRQHDMIPESLLNVILFYKLDIENNDVHSNQRALASNLITANHSAIKYAFNQIYFDFYVLGIKRRRFKYYKHSYDFIFQFMRNDYDIIRDIIPLLEEKLSSKSAKKRLELTRFLGIVFQSDVKVAQNNKTLWKEYLERFYDQSVCIVLAAISAAPSIILSHPDLRDDLLTAFLHAQDRPSSQVRKQIIFSLAELVEQNMGCIVTSTLFWTIMRQRVNDINPEISHNVLEILGKVYDDTMKDSLLLELIKDNIKWIGQTFCCYYLRFTVEHKVHVERIFYLSLVRYKLNPTERMSRLLQIILHVSPVAYESFVAMQVDQCKLRKAFSEWFELLKECGIQEELNVLAQEISKYFPPCLRVSEQLKALSQLILTDKTLFSEFETLTQHITLDQRIELSKSIYKRFYESGNFGDFISLLLQRISMVLIDNSSIKVLMCLIEQLPFEEESEGDGQISVAKRGLELLKLCVVCFPEEFVDKEVLTCLLGFIYVNPTIILTCLTQLSIFPKIRKTFTEVSKKYEIVEICQDHIKNGPCNVIKPSVRLLAGYFIHSDLVINNIIETIGDNLKSADPSNKLHGIVALAHSAGYIPILEGKRNIKLIRELMFDYHDKNIEVQENLQWCPLSNLPAAIQTKVYSIKALINWLLYMSETSMVVTHLVKLIYGRNRILIMETYSEAYYSWIQISIGCSLLKINNYKDIKDHIFAQEYNFLTELILSSGIEFQEIFLEKLTKYMLRDLPFEFIGLYSLFFIKQYTPIKSIAHLKYCSIIRKRTEIFKSIRDDPRRKQEEVDHQIFGNALLFSIITLSSCRALKANDEQSFRALKRAIELVIQPLLDNDTFSYSYYRYMLSQFKNDLNLRIDYKVANKLCTIATDLLTDWTNVPPKKGVPLK